MDSKQRSGFTKTGFSKSGFAACGHFEECQMGKLPCFYEAIDSEVKSLCACYKRNHGTVVYPVTKTKSKSKENKKAASFQDSNEESDKEMEQLSLF